MFYQESFIFYIELFELQKASWASSRYSSRDMAKDDKGSVLRSLRDFLFSVATYFLVIVDPLRKFMA